MSDQSNTSVDPVAVTAAFSGWGVVAYQRVFARVMGGDADDPVGGLWLSQVLYWSARIADDDGWFVQRASDIEESTGLTARMQERVRLVAKQLGILETEQRDLPAMTYFRINMDTLSTLIVKAGEGLKAAKQATTKRGSKRPPAQGGLATTKRGSIHTVKTEEETEEVSAPASQDAATEEIPPEPVILSDHPVIQLCRKIVNRYPDKTLWPLLVEALGQDPDTTKLTGCRVEWVLRGYNKSSWKWATDWYVNGIPPQVVARANSNGRTPFKERDYSVGRRDA
jgi:hypothetical protein